MRARGYVAWVRANAIAIIALHVLVLIGSIALIVLRLPLEADLAALLPRDAPAVRDLHVLEARLRANDTVVVVIQARDAALRAAAARAMADELRAMPRDLVGRVDGDDADARAFVRAHRHLLVPLADLQRARDALAQRIARAKIDANPLYVDLEDAPDDKELDDLRAKRRDAEAKLDRPSNVSDDGTIEMLRVRTPLAATDVAGGHRLIDALGAGRARVVAAHPGVAIGFAGDLVNALAEHRAILDGTLTASAVTAALVGLVLWLYFGSALALALLGVTLAIATAAAFGAAALTVGHLNAATAFLSAIIAGNGVNYGILVYARYLEARRTSEVDDALAVAIAATIKPTLVASLAASTAYGSLAVTTFRGFADFAVIGAIGMALCWIATYLLLPALIVRFGARAPRWRGDRALGRALAFPRTRWIVIGAGALAIASGVIVVRFLAADPFEYDLGNLGSAGADALEERHWMETTDRAFGRGVAGRTVIAADRIDQVPLIVAALRGRGDDTIGSIDSILDVVPADQPARIAVLDQLRALLDDPAIDDPELAELRPPDHLAPITIASLPPSIREALTEKDGRVGLLISIRPADTLDERDGHALVRFANAVSRLDLPNGETVTTSGASVIFADILEAIAHDGPRVTIVAASAIMLLVLALVGANRRAAAVLVATAAGALFMVAACALIGLRVSFLDFVALPITLGLGVDYSINVAARPDDAATRAAVLVCSLTTMIGYGSLLLSENLAIRGFGTASLIGEVTSVSAALLLVPALLSDGGANRGRLQRH
ncbi:MAG TPA: MMPL family transporter [Kofleriaceae bacterium]|nr:MMPL family transporter [Kofleriaceae bacterium]